MPKTYPSRDLNSSHPVEEPPVLTDAQAVQATDAQQIILDLAGLTFVDSSGVHLVARTDARGRTTATRLGLRRGPPQIQRVFALAGADSRVFAA